MMQRMIYTAVLAAGVAIGGYATAKPALKDVAQVRDGIIAVGMAYEISEKCGTIRARTIRGINYLYGLKQVARDLGYSDAEIDAYTDDASEKRRLEAMARAQLAEMGAVAGQEATYCAVGQAEIAKGSAVGRLLR